MKEEEFESKLLLVEEAINDWKKGELTDFTTMIILKQIVSPKKPSPECEKWAREICENEINRIHR
jgi:hypothetical protein